MACHPQETLKFSRIWLRSMSEAHSLPLPLTFESCKDHSGIMWAWGVAENACSQGSQENTSMSLLLSTLFVMILFCSHMPCAFSCFEKLLTCLMCSTLSEGLDVEVPSAAWAVTAQPDDFCFAAQVLEMGEEETQWGESKTWAGVSQSRQGCMWWQRLILTDVTGWSRSR